MKRSYLKKSLDLLLCIYETKWALEADSMEFFSFFPFPFLPFRDKVLLTTGQTGQELTVLLHQPFKFQMCATVTKNLRVWDRRIAVSSSSVWVT